MKKSLFSIIATVILATYSVSAQFVPQYDQCGQNNFTPIQCGYYQEGVQDGASDAQSNRSNDYRRYRNKLDGNKYESFYRQGYEAGYSNLSPNQRWNNEQRNSYDDGFRNGESDRRRNISRLPERYEGRYNRSYEAFYKQGYYDGYDGRVRQYDTAIDGSQNFPTNPTFPSSGGTASGTANWDGKVDDRVNIILQGSQIRTQVLGGNSGQPNSQFVNGVLPSRQSTVSVRKLSGRGEVNVIQQPNRSNGYVAIVQVIDSRRGADDYRLELSWQSDVLVEEPYQSGRVNWKGKADQTVNIVISGSLVQTQDASATGVSNVTSNISGYLARRPGTVSVNKRKGRGTVNVIQQPSEDNDFVAIIQIFDNEKGAGEYEIEITW